MDFSKLTAPFKYEDVEWRLQSCGKNNRGIWAKCLAYITNRAIMDRLDEICGIENWKNEYRQAPQGGVLCGISIKINDEWVTKWDGAENTKIESVKGGLSDSMKRAAVQWGIGRYLYNLDVSFAEIAQDGRYSGTTKDNTWFKWNPPLLPKWALPESPINSETKKPQERQETDKGTRDHIVILMQAMQFPRQGNTPQEIKQAREEAGSWAKVYCQQHNITFQELDVYLQDCKNNDYIWIPGANNFMPRKEN